jgi:hypothetical protein
MFASSLFNRTPDCVGHLMRSNFHYLLPSSSRSSSRCNRMAGSAASSSFQPSRISLFTLRIWKVYHNSPTVELHPPPVEKRQSIESNTFYQKETIITNRNSAQQILIGQRARRRNWRADRENWRVAGGKTIRYPVFKCELVSEVKAFWSGEQLVGCLRNWRPNKHYRENFKNFESSVSQVPAYADSIK